MFSFDMRLLEVALLTILIELPVFYLLGYRKIRQLIAFALVNLISNLLLNEALPAYNGTFNYWVTLLIGELLVVGLEYFLMLYVVFEHRRKLFQAIVITNVVSVVIGLALLF